MYTTRDDVYARLFCRHLLGDARIDRQWREGFLVPSPCYHSRHDSLWNIWLSPSTIKPFISTAIIIYRLFINNTYQDLNTLCDIEFYLYIFKRSISSKLNTTWLSNSMISSLKTPIIQIFRSSMSRYGMAWLSDSSCVKSILLYLTLYSVCRLHEI